MTDIGFQLGAAWPRPHDARAAERLMERFAETSDSAARLAGRPDVSMLLAALGGNSPYLSDLAVREAESLALLAECGPDAVVQQALDAVAAVPVTARREQVASALRRAKRAVALATAVADIGGLWALERITAALSDLAEATLKAAVQHLLRAAYDQGVLRLADPMNPASDSGFCVLAMGKFGARELNYSSDIDLILIYDPSAGIYIGDNERQATPVVTSRLARGLVSLMEQRDADGYVFRTDLRLRPDPAVTPPAVSLPAAIVYYESMGQNWERAAMIKARPVAGDISTGTSFLEAIRPFVWRRGLDFAAVADIHAMKRRIDDYKSGALDATRDPIARIAGHNIKLGHGGIREIEFLAQTLQLVWGGRDPGLRDPTTLGALRLLARSGRLTPAAARELAASYRYLRRLEHRLQMVADRQIHTLPERQDDLARIATFMGYDNIPELAEILLRHLGRVRGHYVEVFESVPAAPEMPPAAAAKLDFRGDDPEPAETVAALRALGFSNTARIVGAVRGWRAGRIRAVRSERARDLIDNILPTLLGALARQPNPDAAFAHFDDFLSRLPLGVQPLSLFQRNPALLERVAAVLGASPLLAEHLASHPAALEGLLSPEEDPDPARLLRARLQDARRLEDVIGIIRRTVREEDFSISVATMEGRLDVDAAGLRRTALADAALAALLDPVLDDLALRYGRVQGGGMVVVALGKAGGREMMAGSDLDLMLIYDHGGDDARSEGGPRSLPAVQYYIRAAHAFVGAVTAPGADGQLYPVDMRLRPSGNKGPVAVSLASFRRYHAESAWTWERMALTRARVVAGPSPLRRHVEAAIKKALTNSGPAYQIRADAAAMRSRMARDLPPSGLWDVKLRPGGQIEVEFITQTLQLIHGRADPALFDPTTRVALQRLADAGHLDEADRTLLIGADRTWRTVQGMLRITLGRGPVKDVPEASSRPLLQATGSVDVPTLGATLQTLAEQVRAGFLRHVGEIA